MIYHCYVVRSNLTLFEFRISEWTLSFVPDTPLRLHLNPKTKWKHRDEGRNQTAKRVAIQLADLVLWILRTNNYTKAAVPMLSKFSKHRSTSSSKLLMKRWHVIFNTIVKESALKRHFIYVYAISLLLLIQSVHSIRQWNCSTDILEIVPPTSFLKGQ